MVQPGKVSLKWEELHDDTKRLLSLSGIISGTTVEVLQNCGAVVIRFIDRDFG
jgi:hypothetical protein